MSFPPPLSSSPTPPLLEIRDLAGWRGGRPLFEGIGLVLNAGELLHVQGSNGSGKTTFLRMLVGLMPPHEGDLNWKGSTVRGEAFRSELFYLGHHHAIKEEFTPLENLLATAHLAQEGLSEDDALDALAQVGLAGREDLACKYLSQGQKRRVALARLVHERRPLWVLDEPFVALDTAAVAWLVDFLGAHLRRGGCVVMTTHQPVDIAAASVRVLRLGA